MFATDSVILLLTFLVKEHNSTPGFLNKITKVAKECADAYEKQIISSMNQEDLAIKYAEQYFEKPN